MDSGIKTKEMQMNEKNTGAPQNAAIHSNTSSQNRMLTQGKAGSLAMTGLMAAVICVMGPMAIPIPVSPVPVSLGNLALFLAVYVVGMRRAAASYLIYLLLGFVGLPVFTGFTGGPAKLLGPTGGYLIGFLPMVLIAGAFIDKWGNKKHMCFIGLLLGAAVCDLMGTAWLAYQAEMNFGAALAAGVLPFIPGDLGKIVLAMIAGPQIRRRMQG